MNIHRALLIGILIVSYSLCLVGQGKTSLQIGTISLVGPSHYRTEVYLGHFDLQIHSQNILAGAYLGLSWETNESGKSLLGFYISGRCDYTKFSQEYNYEQWVDPISDVEIEIDGLYKVQAVSLQIPVLLSINLLESRLNLLAGLTYRKMLNIDVEHSFKQTTNYFQMTLDPAADYFPYFPPRISHSTNTYKRNFQKVLGTLGARLQTLELFNSKMAIVLQVDFPLDTKFQGQIESNERLVVHLGLQIPLHK